MLEQPPTLTPLLHRINEMPLDELLDLRPEEMNPEELTAYVQRCSVLRSSAQTRRATLVKEGGGTTKKKSVSSVNSVSRAMELLAQINKQRKEGGGTNA